MDPSSLMALYVRQLELGPKKNFVYLVGPADGPQVAVVDPAWDVDALFAAADEDQRRIAAVFLTHSHDDHVNGVPALLERTQVPVYASPEEIAFSSVLKRWGSTLTPLESGASFSIGSLQARSLHTPGHTPGAHCLHVEDALFSGDTLFVNGCGRCDFAGGNPRAMYRSLHVTLVKLPDATRLFAGHDYGDVKVSSLGRERAQNPYFQQPNEEAFVAYRMRPRA